MHLGPVPSPCHFDQSNGNNTTCNDIGSDENNSFIRIQGFGDCNGKCHKNNMINEVDTDNSCLYI